MTDKQINRWLRRRFSPTGWVLLAYYALLNGLALLAMAWEALRQVYFMDHRGPLWFQQLDMDALMNNAWGYITAMAVVFLILHAWKGPNYWREEVFAKEKKMPFGIFCVMLCLCVGTQLVNTLWVMGLEWLCNLNDKSLMPMMEAVSGASDSFSMFLYASVLAPIGEELLFRGYVLRTLRPYGKRFAVLGSAFLFGLFHGNLLQTPYAFLMGLILGYTAVEYSVGWAIGLHMFNNFVLADLLTRITYLMPAGAGELLNLVLLGGCFLGAVVILVRKRAEIGQHIRSEWMDRRVVKCFFTSAGILALTAVMVANILLVMP